jgi:23S rRNA (guanosine2251-2'-O)-methyltransferase
VTSPVAYGIHAVRVLLSRNPQRVRRVLLGVGRDAGRLAEIRGLAQRAGVQVATADDATLDRLAGGERHQGVVAEVQPRAGDPETQLEEALEAAGGAPLLLVLDGV